MRSRLVRALAALPMAVAALVAVPSSSDALSSASAECADGPIGTVVDTSDDHGIVTIPVVFHVVHRSDGTANLPDATVAAQLAQLNKDFSGREAPGVAADTGFRFRLTATRRWQNDEWFDNSPDPGARDAIRVATREGGKTTLNIWSTNIPHAGEATFAWEAETRKEKDGVVIKWTTVPGGSEPNHNQGKVASHEAGHWLGLHHTFEFGCQNEGDEVVDTPAHLGNFDCEEDDTCEQPGTDPIHNYMNGTGDACQNQFTRGQAARAHAQWKAHRASSAT